MIYQLNRYDISLLPENISLLFKLREVAFIQRRMRIRRWQRRRRRTRGGGGGGGGRGGRQGGGGRGRDGGG